MIPNIAFIITILNWLHTVHDYVIRTDDDYAFDDDINVILNFINIIPTILEIFSKGYELTKYLSRENDAYKLIRYIAEFRFENNILIHL